MVEYALTGGATRTERLLKAVLLFGVAVPGALLVATYYGSAAVNVAFGNVVFAFTGLAVLVSIAAAGWGGRTDAARPTGELLRNSATEYGANQEGIERRGLPTPARLVLVAVGTVVLGWACLIATL